jgi:hypothetical protein
LIPPDDVLVWTFHAQIMVNSMPAGNARSASKPHWGDKFQPAPVSLSTLPATIWGHADGMDGRKPVTATS